MIAYRPATEDDCQGIAAVYTEAFLKNPVIDDWVIENFSKALARTDKAFFVATHADRVVGFAELTLNSTDTTAHLNNLHVLQRYQGRNIGRQLFLRASRKAAACGFGRLGWGPTPQSRPFYDKVTAGWRIRKGRNLWSCDITKV